MAEFYERKDERITEKRWSLDVAEPAIRFSYYDHWEYYNEDKEYYTGPFRADYGHGTDTYIWEAYGKSSLVAPQFMVASLYVTPEELKELAPFCRCAYCVQAERWRKSACCGTILLKYLPNVLTVIFLHYTCGCAGCYGCIKNGHGTGGSPRNEIIKDARAYKKKIKAIFYLRNSPHLK